MRRSCSANWLSKNHERGDEGRHCMGMDKKKLDKRNVLLNIMNRDHHAKEIIVDKNKRIKNSANIF